MIHAILEFLMQCKGEAIMAVFPIAAVASLAQMGYGAVKEGQQRAKMGAERSKWSAENEALFNKDYYTDATKRADALNVIRLMREQNNKADKVEQNTAAVTGATPEAVNAGKERRNRGMTNLFGAIAAQGTAYKERTKDRYLARKTALEGLEYDDMAATAESAGNVMANGINGLATTDWAGILKGGGGRNVAMKALPTPKVGVTVTGGPVIPTKLPGF